MAPPHPQLTSRALVEELMQIYEATGQEDLARKLDRPVRTIQRWLSGKGMSWENAIDLLTVAGRLQDGPSATSEARQIRLERTADRLAAEAAALRRALELDGDH